MASESISVTAMASATTSSLPPSQSAEIMHLEHVQHVDETVYLLLQVIGGQILLPILLFTIIFSKRVATRNPVFVNFTLSWIISSIVYSIFVYRDRSTLELQLVINANPCLVQSALINGVQALTACSTLALIINVWSVIRSSTNDGNKPKSPWESHQTLVLLVLPYLAFVTFTIISITLGSPEGLGTDGSPVSNNLAIPSVFYCVIFLNTTDGSQDLSKGFQLFRAVYGFTCAMMLITIVFEVHLATIYYRNRKPMSSITSRSPLHPLFFLLRLVLFSTFRLVSLGLMIALLVHPEEIFLVGLSKENVYNGPIDFFQAALPLVAFIFFGTQKDVLEVWSFWKKPMPVEDCAKSEISA